VFLRRCEQISSCEGCETSGSEAVDLGLEIETEGAEVERA
jgi:hypothetical protein